MVSNEAAQYVSTLVQHRRLFIFVSTQTVHTAGGFAFCIRSVPERPCYLIC